MRRIASKKVAPLAAATSVFLGTAPASYTSCVSYGYGNNAVNNAVTFEKPAVPVTFPTARWHCQQLETPLPVPFELAQVRTGGVWIADEEQMGVMHLCLWIPAYANLAVALANLPATRLAGLRESPHFGRDTRVLAIREGTNGTAPAFVAVFHADDDGYPQFAVDGGQVHGE